MPDREGQVRRQAALSIISRGALVLFGLVLGLLVCEALVRMVFPDWSPRTVSISELWQHDSTLGWTHIPGSKTQFTAFGLATAVSINSKGFRDSERRYERDAPKYRIVVLGDSMVWGYGVEQEKVFTALLEQHRPALEVINLGVSGYGTDQEYLLLQQEGTRYQPDMLMLVFCENDFISNIRKKMFLVYQKPLFTLQPDGVLALQNVPVPKQTMLERAGIILTRNSYLITRAASAYAEFSVRGTPGPGIPTTEPGVPKQFPIGQDERATVAMINAIWTTSKSLNTEFLLVLTDGMGRRGREMKAFFESHGMRVVNLDDAGLSESGARRYHLPDDAHWSAQGHEAVAEYLVKYLDSQPTR